MYNPTSMTIRELPKTKKMAVDELHPVLKIQKNVLNHQRRNLHWRKNKNWAKSEWSTVQHFQWC
jgi:hypothetical protein